MAASETVLRGVVCDDREEMRRAVGALMERCDIAVEGSVGDLAGLLDVAGRAAVDVAVLTLPVLGSHGLGAVRALRRAVPGCQVVVVSPFDRLEPFVLAAGARALVGEQDLRPLASVLRTVVGDAERSGRSVWPPAQRAPEVTETYASEPGRSPHRPAS